MVPGDRRHMHDTMPYLVIGRPRKTVTTLIETITVKDYTCGKERERPGLISKWNQQPIHSAYRHQHNHRPLVDSPQQDFVFRITIIGRTMIQKRCCQYKNPCMMQPCDSCVESMSDVRYEQQ